MTYNKVVFIIPGFRQAPTSKAYKSIAKILKNVGFYPIIVSIPWRGSTISQNTEYFLKVFKNTRAREKYVFGFSFGAMIALIAASKVNVKGLILCSLSPYFKEDISKKVQTGQTQLMQKRYDDFKKFDAKILAKKTTAKKILMLYGSHESKPLTRRVINTFDKIPKTRKQLIRVLKTEHEIGNWRYLYAIKEVTRGMFM